MKYPSGGIEPAEFFKNNAMKIWEYEWMEELLYQAAAIQPKVKNMSSNPG